MIFTDEQIKIAFGDWSTAALITNYPNLEISQGFDSDAPRDNLPALTYHVAGYNPIGHYETFPPDENGDTIIKGTVEIPVYFKAYGSEGLNILEQLRARCNDETFMMDELYGTTENPKYKIGFGYMMTPPTSLPILRDGVRYESFGSMDLVFRTHSEFAIVVNTIGTVEVEIDYNDGEIIDNIIIENL